MLGAGRDNHAKSILNLVLHSIYNYFAGAGIKPETMSHLFQKFSRASDASKYNLFGTGLGLYLASELLKAHTGKIWAESEGKGKGSTFYIELPME